MADSDPMATLSADELESWTLLDSSPRRTPNPPVPPMEKNSKDRPSRVEDEEEDDDGDEEEEVSEAESASEEEEEEQVKEEDEKEEVKEKTSRVEVVQREKGASARDSTIKDDDAGQQQGKKSRKNRKKRTDSERSGDSHDDLSSDGISVISESSDAEPHRKVHLAKGIRLGSGDQPLLPEVGTVLEQTQLSRRSPGRSSDESKELVRPDALVPWNQVGKTSVVLVGMVVTALVAILVGNSRTFNNRVDEYKFQHEQRISELELENNILKNEMNKLKHLYTRSELDEQVQQADVEWAKVLEEKLAEEQAQQQVEPEPEPEPTAEPESPAEEPLVFRKVPPQDEDIKHRVVWSGDDGQPMLIADKDYVLPDFCFNKNAVQDDLFSEYSTKYCDIKKRKVEAKLRKAEYARKNHKRYKEPKKDYTDYIIPTQEEIEEYQMKSQIPLPKPPSLSPFEFDYKKAFETIKEEGAVIVDSLVAILDLDPEPEYFPAPTPSSSSLSEGETGNHQADSTASYQADDEASPTSGSSAESVPEPNWESYPPWVKEKYANQPEMHGKLRNKERLLWDWEHKKNEFLHEVRLETLEEVDRKTEDELRLRREEYRSRNGRQPQQSGEYGRNGYKENRKHDGRRKEEYRGDKKQYDDRRGSKEQRYDERKEWKDRGARSSEENRSREHNNDNDRYPNNGKQPWKNDSDENQRKSSEYRGESSKEWKNSKESRESSGGGKPYHNKKKDWNDSGEHRDGKPHYKKDSSKESSSGDGKPYYKKQDAWKDGSGERDGKPYHKKHWKQDGSGGYSGEHHHGKRRDFSDERKDDKRQGGGPKRNGDQWNWSKDDSGEDHSGEGSYLSQYRRSGEDDHHRKKDGGKFEGKRKFHDDDDDDDDDDHRKKYHSKEDHHRKHHKDGDHWKKGKKHHDGDRKWQEHSQERRR